MDLSKLTPAIDFHVHFVPQVYRDALAAAGIDRPDGMPGIPAWSEDEALAFMGRFGIGKSILSISSPGLFFGDLAATHQLARSVNDEGAALCRRHPDQFGFFASLPIPDVAASLLEIDRAFDELGASGVVLMSNYGGVYTGDPAFEPIFEALDKRNAVVFLHPTAPRHAGPEDVPFPPPLFEFLFDTTRAVTTLIFSRRLETYKNVQLIVAHAGAVLPGLADRIDAVGNRLVKSDGGPVLVIDQLKRLYYELGGFPAPHHLAALRSLVSDEQLVWGTDWPHTLEPMIQKSQKALMEPGQLSPHAIDDARVHNARKLLKMAAPGNYN